MLRESLENELRSLRKLVEKQNEEISRCVGVERSLRESEEKYRFLVENSKDIIWKIDLQSRWTFVSSNVEKILGYRPDEVVGRLIWDFIAPEDHGRIKETLHRRKQGEDIPPYEIDVIAKDGHHVPFEVLTTSIMENGKIIGVQGISRDIAYRREAERRLKSAYEGLEARVRERTSALTEINQKLQKEINERRMTEMALRESERKFRAIFDGTFQFLGLLAIDGTLLDVNRAALEAVGVNKSDVVGKPFWETPWCTYTREISEKIRDSIIKAGQGEFVRFETTILAADGRLHYIDYSLKPAVDESGRAILLIPEGRDITDRKRAEEALRESEEKFRAIFDQTYQFIGLVAVDGTFLDANKTALDFIGAKKSDVVGKPFWETPWWTHSPELQEKLHAAIKTAARGEFARFEASHRAADGSLHYFDFSIKPVRDRSGRVTMLIPEGRDITQRKLIENSLRESEEKFRVLAETSAAAIFVYQNLRFVSVNQAAVRITGYSKDELLGMSITDFVHPDFTKMVYERGQARQRGEPVPARYELKLVTKAGDEKWVELTAGRIMYEGRPAVVATLFDITERKRAEEKARFTKFAVDNFIDPSIWLDAEGRIVYVNKAACKSLGYSADELLSMRVWDIDPAYTYEKFIERWNETKQKRAITFETTHVRKDGSSYPVEISANYLRFEDKEYAVTFDRNITLRKQADEALRMSEARLAMAQAIAHLGSWDIDIASHSMAWSDELYRIYGVRPGEFTPSIEAVIEATHPDDREAFRSAFQRISSGLKPEIIEHRIVRPDGSIRLVRAEGKIVYDQQGKPTRIFGTAQDITEQKKAQNELEDAKAQAELYLDLMSHDINNMNQIALGYLEMADDLVESGVKLGKDNRELIDKPIASLKNSSMLIDKVMKLRRLKARSIRLEQVNICTVLGRIKDRYSHITDRDVTINYMPAQECLVVANELIDEIFTNLVENSLKHSPHDKPLVIDIRQTMVCEAGKEYFRISVEDNGPGIPDRVKKKLFARYYRGETRVKGKGLGLYLVKTLVKDFHGRVWVEDRVPGNHTKGARFVIMLPSADHRR